MRGMALDPILTAQELSALRGVALFDCRPEEAAYHAGHIEGALHAQLERDLSAPALEPAQGGRHPLPSVREFCGRLGRWGVTPGTHAVAYDDQKGANAAARLWWMLRALGHGAVRVVDGGLPALVAAGFRLTSEVPALAAAPRYPADIWQWPLADIDEVERARLDPARRGAFESASSNERLKTPRSHASASSKARARAASTTP